MAIGIWNEAPARDIAKFAGKFLAALYEDGAVVPDTLQISAPETLKPTMRRRRLSWQSAGGVFFLIDRRRSCKMRDRGIVRV